MKILVVVESTGEKMKSVDKALNSLGDGNTYVIAGSGGHIMDLNKEKTIGVDIANNYAPDYVVTEHGARAVQNLKKLHRACAKTWVASDLDQEGEFIGWSVMHVLGLPPETTPRLIFNDTSVQTLHRAAKNPSLIDWNRLEAQRCRRVMDRLIGFQISQAASTVNNKLTIGRVQTMMVKAVIDREKECEQFQKNFSFHTSGLFKKELDAKLNKTIESSETIEEFFIDCQNSEFIVSEKSDRIATSNPPQPLITQKLQALVSQRLGISPKSVLDIAQNLYNKGVTSYPRTDCPRLPDDKLEACRDFVLDKWGPDYHQERNFESKNESSQDAHACIYPTDVTMSELQDGSGNSPDNTWSNTDRKVYKIIWQHVVASQMKPSQTKVTKIKIKISKREKEWFISENHQLVFEGYLKVFGKNVSNDTNANANANANADADADANADANADADAVDSDDIATVGTDGSKNKEILQLVDGDKLIVNKIESIQKASRGPSPYNQGQLIDKMDACGIGRPATHGKILEDVLTKDFIYRASKSGEKVPITLYQWEPTKHDGEIIELQKEVSLNAYRDRLYSTELGRAINDFVDQFFPELFNYEFTRELQHEMDQIEHGAIKWHQVVDKLYRTFSPKLKQFPKYRTKKDGANPAWKPKLEIGKHDGQPVYSYLAKYGPVLQIGDDDNKDKRYVKLPKEFSVDKVTIDEVKYLIGFPYHLGELKDGRSVYLRNGNKYGLYLEAGKKNYNAKPEMFKDFNQDLGMELQIDHLDLSLIEPIILETDQPKNILREVEGIQIVSGKYGPYFLYQNTIVGIPEKSHKVELVSYDDLMELYRNKVFKKTGGPRKKFTIPTKKQK